jgi:DNA invertase Pin-like site-specific DNA recombinase
MLLLRLVGNRAFVDHRKGVIMRIALYVRVSKTGLNTDNQLVDLREFASKQGWEIVAEFVETVTGSGLKQRKEFDRMMAAASRREFDLLLFWKLDRLTREGVSGTLRYLEQLKAWGVGWRSLQEPWLDTGSQLVTDIVLSVIAAMAKQERQTLIDRTMAGLRTAKRNGKVLGRPRRAVDWKEVNARHLAGESVRSIGRSMKISHSLLLKGLAQ